MDFLTLISKKEKINQAALAVPMALGQNDKFTPFKNRLQEEKPDAVIWQADAIADDFSKEVIWDQVKQGGAQAVDEGELSAMKKASMKAELDKAHEEFLGNWPQIQQQIVLELAQNAKETVGDRFLILAYSNKEAGGQGEMGPADQAFFLTSALKVAGDCFDAVFIPNQLDENLQEKVIEAAKAAQVPFIVSTILTDMDRADLEEQFQKAIKSGAAFLNIELSADFLGQFDVADLDELLVTLKEQYREQVKLVLSMTGLLTKDQLESWLVLPSAFVTLALSEQYQTPMVQSTIKELGWN